ncbi:MAG: methylmalonyl-CoA mutase family protein [Planctomycetota bacterium]
MPEHTPGSPPTTRSIFDEPFTPKGIFEPTTFETWHATVLKDLNGAPFEKKLVTHTYEGIDLQPLYTRRDWPGDSPPHGSPAPDRNGSGSSGVAPFTRGGLPLGNRDHGWEIRQEHKEPRLDQLNASILDDLENGVGSILLRLDLAGRRGLDPDNPLASQLVGRDGASIATVDDLDKAFEGVHLNMIGVALEAGAAFEPAAALLLALYHKRNVPKAETRIHFCADPLAVLARDGVLPMETDRAMQRLAELGRHTSANLPASRAVRVGTAPYHHAGATAVQDLAFSMASAVAYLRTLTAAGLSLADASKQLLFSYAIGCNQFLAIAKLRAARKLYARLIEAAGGTGPAQRMVIHARTSKRVITARDPWVNLLRNTVCAFASGVAGADIITTGTYNEAVSLPSTLSRRIARNTQHVLMEESHIHRVSDPAGGCWFIEHLTDEFAEKAWETFQSIEARGGMETCLRSGWVADQIDSAFAPRSKDIATRKAPITGVSEFPNLSESPLDADTISLPALLGERRGHVYAHRERTGRNIVTDADLTALAEQASQGATLGDIAAALFEPEDETTHTRLTSAIAPHPYAEAFERLRDASDEHEARCGYRARVFLASIGSPPQHTARSAFAKNFFQAGGFEVIANDGFATADDAAAAFAESGAGVAVICSSDAVYESVAHEVGSKLRRAGARSVVLAGNPGNNESMYRAAGIDRFIFVKCDVLGVLTEIAHEEGVLSA